MTYVLATLIILAAFWALNTQFVAWDKPSAEHEPDPEPVFVTYPPLEPLELVPVARGYEVELAQQAGLLLCTTPDGARLPRWYVDAYVELAALSVPRKDALDAVRQGEKATRTLIEREVSRLRGQAARKETT